MLLVSTGPLTPYPVFLEPREKYSFNIPRIIFLKVKLYAFHLLLKIFHYLVAFRSNLSVWCSSPILYRLKCLRRKEMNRPNIITIISFASTMNQILIRHFHMHHSSHRLGRWHYFHYVQFIEQSNNASKIIEFVGGRARSWIKDHLLLKDMLFLLFHIICLLHQAIYFGQREHLTKLRIQLVVSSLEVVLELVSSCSFFQF